VFGASDVSESRQLSVVTTDVMTELQPPTEGDELGVQLGVPQRSTM